LLMAKNQEDHLVSLLMLSRDEIDACRKIDFYCPCCEGRVFLKAGKIKLPHFAHAPHQICDAVSEGETEEHLLGKKQLYEWLVKQHYEVELEKYFTTFKQRADLYVMVNGKEYAIEFQCSVISLEQIKKRTKMYVKHHITPIWILSERHVKWKKRNGFMLSAFHWLTSTGTILLPKLLAYSPTVSQFTILQQLTPFSKRYTIAYPKQVHHTQLTFSELINTPSSYPLQNQMWQNKKQLWRLNAASFATLDNPFYQALYQAGYSPAIIPNECGIPVPYMHLYETDAIQWQFWLYEKVLRPKVVGEGILPHEWRAALIQCIKEMKIVVRPLPQIRLTNPFLPLEHYISMLEKLGVLKRKHDIHLYTRALEPFNLASPQNEAVFYRMVKNHYDELMRKENGKMFTEKAGFL